MSAEALISVIIPAFNAERFIDETLESVLRQTHARLEVIIVDDGSTDGTRRVVADAATKDPRIQILAQRNAGVSAARNAGARVAKGDFFVFLDADDTLSADSLERKLRKMEAEPSLTLVHCDHLCIQEDSRVLEKVYSFPKEGDILDDLLLLDEKTSIFCIGSCLVKKDVFEISGGFDPRLSNSADHDFYFRLAKLGPIGRVARVGFFYRLHASNMHSNITLLERDLLLAYRLSDERALFKDRWFRRKCYANMYFSLAGSWWKDGGNRWKGGGYILKSLLMHPPILVRLLQKVWRTCRGAPVR